MMTMEIWIKGVLSVLENIASIQYQKKTWFPSSPKYDNSFGEMICMLYDDMIFDRFIEKLQENQNLQEDVTKIACFRDELNCFVNKVPNNEDPLKIINDPEWISLTNEAKEICAILKKILLKKSYVNFISP